MEQINIPKSLVEQILDQMFTRIEKQDIFDTQTVQKLKQLATNGELKKSASITIVIKSIQEKIP